MKCEEVDAELAAYVHNEISPPMRAEIEQHLAHCPQCAQELARTESILRDWRESLPAFRPAAGFAQRVLQRLHQEEAQNGEPAGISHSGRRYRQVNPSLTRRVRLTLQRSPYFAASLLLHAAAAVIVIALLVRLDRQKTELVYNTIPEGKRVYSITLDPGKAVLHAAYLERKDRPSTRVPGERTAEGVRLDVPQFLTDGELVLVDAPELGCIKAYRRQTAAVGQTVPVRNSTVTLPQPLAAARFGEQLDVRVIDFADRVEFWPERRWRELAAQALISLALPLSEQADRLRLAAVLIRPTNLL